MIRKQSFLKIRMLKALKHTHRYILGHKLHLCKRTVRYKSNFRISESILPKTFEYIDIKSLNNDQDIEEIKRGLRIYPEFITQSEHDDLVEEVNRYFKNKKYVEDHWDNVINNYRETMKANWSQKNLEILNKVKSMFIGNIFWQYGVHVLDLAPNGPIDAHIDSVSTSGEILSGLSLLSTTVMTLKKENTIIDMLLPPRTLYIMTNEIRYHYTHEIPANEFTWKGETRKRERRISIMFRDEHEDTIKYYTENNDI